MHKALLIMLAVGGGGAAFAQTTQAAPPLRDAGPETTSAQRRTELRNVLSAGRRAEPTARIESVEAAGRQLSQQERAEMREQLRRYQPPIAPRAQRP